MLGWGEGPVFVGRPLYTVHTRACVRARARNTFPPLLCEKE